MNKTVREKIGQINGLLKPALKTNAAMLADWQASKRIRQLPVNPTAVGRVTVKLPDVPDTPVLLWSRTDSVCVPAEGAVALKEKLPPLMVGLGAAV